MQKYHLSLRIAHWAFALIIATLLCAVWFADFGDKRAMFGLHKSFGLLVLGLVFVRIVIRRRTFRADAHQSAGLNDRLARGVHRLMYGLMICVPLSMATASMLNARRGLDFFGWHIRPLADNPALAKTIASLHVPLAYTFVALIAGHLVMAAYHFIHDRRTLRHQAGG